jgi:hypothetical protein
MNSVVIDKSMMRVGVITGSSEVPVIPRLLAVLESVMRVRFEGRVLGDYEGLNGVILLRESHQEAERMRVAGIHCLHFPLGELLVSEKVREEIRFADHRDVPEPLRKRVIHNDVAPACSPITPPTGAETLASSSKGPIWVIMHDGQIRHDCSLLPLPRLTDSSGLFDYLNASSFVQVLPLIAFLRFLAGDEEESPPPIRACFMFDDPNLHWKSYGCIDYRELAEHAVKHNYHVAFATIPLDHWFVHLPTAKLFRDCSKTLSLLVHGNNHTLKELAQTCSPERRVALLNQALQRIRRLEARSGCQVSRVMAAPHGACREGMMEDMASLGFEAACISHGSLRAHNPGKSWTGSVGFGMTEMVAGLPIIPRFGLSKESRNSILLAVLLHQPVIAMGHHQDVCEGLDLLADLADFINSLGQVQWMDMQSIARSNYYSRQDGDVLHIKMFSRRIQLTVPPGMSKLVINRIGQGGLKREEVWWHPSGAHTHPIKVSESSEIACAGHREIEIYVSFQNLNQLKTFPRPLPPLWPLTRRLMSEARDRSVAWLRQPAKKT